MGRFHILEVRKGTPSFREVTGEAVEIGEGIQAFFMRPPSGEWHCLYDVASGARITDIYDTDVEARVAAETWLNKNGVLRWHDSRMAYAVKYDLPPEVIEIIQESQIPGEIETCRRETHCGHR